MINIRPHGSLVSTRKTVVLGMIIIGLCSCTALGKLNPFASKQAKQAQPQALEKSPEQTPPTAAPATDVGSENTSAPDLKKLQSPPAQEETSQKAAEEKPAQSTGEETAPSSSVEILWQVPGEPVEKYHLNYGTDAEHLDQSKEIPVGDLEKIDHPVHGALFRYVLTGVEPGKRFFFTIQAENQYGLSPKSPVQEIK
jgi:hypothetical protein